MVSAVSLLNEALRKRDRSAPEARAARLLRPAPAAPSGRLRRCAVALGVFLAAAVLLLAAGRHWLPAVVTGSARSDRPASSAPVAARNPPPASSGIQDRDEMNTAVDVPPDLQPSTNASGQQSSTAHLRAARTGLPKPVAAEAAGAGTAQRFAQTADFALPMVSRGGPDRSAGAIATGIPEPATIVQPPRPSGGSPTPPSLPRAERPPGLPHQRALQDRRQDQPLDGSPSADDGEEDTETRGGLQNACYLKALVYHRQNRLTEAIAMYRKALQTDPSHIQALFNLAAVCLETGAFSEAYPLLQRLHEMRPQNEDLQINLAIAAIGLGQPRRALAHLDRIDAGDPELQFRVYFHRGAAFSRARDLDQALRWYKQAEALQPRHGHLLFNLALVYDRLQHYPQALTYYDKFMAQKDSGPAAERRMVADRIRLLRGYTNSAGGREYE